MILLLVLGLLYVYALRWITVHFSYTPSRLSTKSFPIRSKKTLSKTVMLCIIEGFPAKRAYIAFRTDFYFCRIELSFGGLTYVAMKSIVV